MAAYSEIRQLSVPDLEHIPRSHLREKETSLCQESNGVSSPSHIIGLNPALESGHLVISIRSRCRLCGKELVDPRDLPDEFLQHGIQIPPEEYRDAVAMLMEDRKFRCHIWCYNMPVAMVLFTFFLGLCLTVIPVLETKVVFHGKTSGLEYVHATVLWLCILTLYLVILQLAKIKLKNSMYKKLAEVNSSLIKYNLLAGIEDLGIIDCNKYFLHFFYYEIGPCLGYLQELLVNGDHSGAGFHNGIDIIERSPSEPENVVLNIDGSEETALGKHSDMSHLNPDSFTNTNLQNQAEELLLKNSGEYISLLMAKKLDCPSSTRHVTDSLCICQYVERKLYDIKV